MPLGGFAPLPLRLGDDFTAAHHARMCADLLSVKRVSPLYWVTFTGDTVHDYSGQNGVGVAFKPSSITLLGTGIVELDWTSASFEDAYEIFYPIIIRQAKASLQTTTSGFATHVLTDGKKITVYTFDSAGAAATLKATLKVW